MKVSHTVMTESRDDLTFRFTEGATMGEDGTEELTLPDFEELFTEHDSEDRILAKEVIINLDLDLDAGVYILSSGASEEQARAATGDTSIEGVTRSDKNIRVTENSEFTIAIVEDSKYVEAAKTSESVDADKSNQKIYLIPVKITNIPVIDTESVKVRAEKISNYEWRVYFEPGKNELTLTNPLGESGIQYDERQHLYYHTFRANGEYIFNYRDAVGNTGTITGSVDQIPANTDPETLEGGVRWWPYEGTDQAVLTTKKVKLIDRRGNEVEYTDNGDGTVTFRMPQSNVSIEAEFAHICPSLDFPDLDVTKWYHEYTDYAIFYGIMNGRNAGLFAPEGNATRAEMVTTLWNLAGRETVDFDISFTDVAEDEWYYDAIRWAAGVGVVNGYGDNTFRPDQPISREEMAVMLYRYEKNVMPGGSQEELSIELPFPDWDNVQSWAGEAMSWCVENGIFQGDEKGRINPEKNARRAELAKILTVYLRLNKNR